MVQNMLIIQTVVPDTPRSLDDADAINSGRQLTAAKSRVPPCGRRWGSLRSILWFFPCVISLAIFPAIVQIASCFWYVKYQLRENIMRKMEPGNVMSWRTCGNVTKSGSDDCVSLWGWASWGRTGLDPVTQWQANKDKPYMRNWTWPVLCLCTD